MSGTVAICPGNGVESSAVASFHSAHRQPGQSVTDRTRGNLQSDCEPGRTGTHSYRSVPLSRSDASTGYFSSKPAMMIVQVTTANTPAARANGSTILRPSARVSLVEVAMQINSSAPMIMYTANPFGPILFETSRVNCTIKQIPYSFQLVRVLTYGAALRGRRVPTLQALQNLYEGLRFQ